MCAIVWKQTSFVRRTGPLPELPKIELNKDYIERFIIDDEPRVVSLADPVSVPLQKGLGHDPEKTTIPGIHGFDRNYSGLSADTCRCNYR